jgi:hypothetical protein
LTRSSIKRADIPILACERGGNQAEALAFSEGQLNDLMNKASHAGVLSQGFIGKLRRKIEI